MFLRLCTVHIPTIHSLYFTPGKGVLVDLKRDPNRTANLKPSRNIVLAASFVERFSGVFQGKYLQRSMLL
jgi:hypothetical protein